jgi:hypothetical protein
MESADLVEESFDSFKKPGDKFIEGVNKRNKRTGKESSITLARRGKTMTSPVVVYVDGKEWKVFPSKKTANKAVEQEYKHMRESIDENLDMDKFKQMAATQLHFIHYAAEEMLECLHDGCPMPEWFLNKLAKVQGEVEGLHSYMEGKTRKMESQPGYQMDEDLDVMLAERVSRREFGKLQGTWKDSISKNVIEFDENGMGFVVEDKQGRVHEFEYKNMNVLKEEIQEKVHRVDEMFSVGDRISFLHPRNKRRVEGTVMQESADLLTVKWSGGTIDIDPVKTKGSIA